MMNDKSKLSTDISRYKHQIHDLRNDENLQLMLSSAMKLETLEQSVSWAQCQVLSKGLELIIFEDVFAGFCKLFRTSTDIEGAVFSVGIAVIEPYRGLGIARNTLQRKFKTLSKGDCIVTSIKKNNHASLKLFLSLGFQKLSIDSFRGVKISSSDWILVTKTI